MKEILENWQRFLEEELLTEEAPAPPVPDPSPAKWKPTNAAQVAAMARAKGPEFSADFMKDMVADEEEDEAPTQMLPGVADFHQLNQRWINSVYG